MRVGLGYDVHQFADDRPLILGGVNIPWNRGLAGHSDADVLVHAIIDALLGAAALGDIGSHFPDTDDTWLGVDSFRLLETTRDLLENQGYRIVNVDATVSAQAPKLRPYIDEMRLRLAEGLGVDIGQISVKATTTERLGFVGREEGLESRAICLIESKP